MALATCPCAFLLRRLAQTALPVFLHLGLRHFASTFSHGSALVTCPSASPLRSSAQILDFGVRHFSSEFLHDFPECVAKGSRFTLWGSGGGGVFAGRRFGLRERLQLFATVRNRL